MIRKTFLVFFIATVCNVKCQTNTATEESSLEPTSLEPTTFETTSQQEKNYVEGCFFPCGSLPNGEYADPWNNCTGHYYFCNQGMCENAYCDPYLVYDPKNYNCVCPSDWVGCSGYNKSETCNFNCGNKPDGDYADPTSSCTAHYFVCASGMCCNFYCPPNLVYDPKNEECVYPWDWVGCAGTTVAVQTSSTVSGAVVSTTQRYTPPACNFNCGNKPDGDYADPTNSCTAHYFVCANGECFNFYCHDPLVYDPDNDECVYPQDWPGCATSTLSHSPLA